MAPIVHGYFVLPHAGEPVAANRFGTQLLAQGIADATLFEVPTTLNTANALLPSVPTSSSMLCAVFAALYSSSLSTVSILYFLPPIVTPPCSLVYLKYALQPCRDLRERGRQARTAGSWKRA